MKSIHFSLVVHVINMLAKRLKIPLTLVVCCNVNFLKIFVSRGYKTMMGRKKIGSLKFLLNFLNIWSKRSTGHTKKEKNMLGSTFFALKIGAFWAFFPCWQLVAWCMLCWPVTQCRKIWNVKQRIFPPQSSNLQLQSSWDLSFPSTKSNIVITQLISKNTAH